MIITLVGADFSKNNIGKLSTWLVQTSFGSGVTHTGAGYVDLGAAYSTTITIAEGYELNGSVAVTMGGNAITEGITVDGNTITISIASVTGNVLIKVPTKNTATGEEGGNDDIIPDPDEPIIGTIDVTWEVGAIDSSKGPNASTVMNSRVRTQGYIQVNSSITISASGNAEFCPVYYKADKGYISSPNVYQTDTLTVSGDTYPLVRIMIRDKSNTSGNLTSDFGTNYITITGDGVEIPYSTSDEGTSSSDANGLYDGTTWKVEAIDSSTGKVATMSTRIHTGYIPLGSATVSVTGGDAEFCPFLYDSSKKLKSTPAVYQTTSQTFTSADGAYLVLMARNKSNTSATLTADYGNNISIVTA